MTAYDVDKEIVDLLVAQTGKEVGYCNPPADGYPQTPYAVVTPQVSPPPDGDLGSQERNAWQNYTIEAIGDDPRQVRWLQGRIRAVLLTAGTVTSAQWVQQQSSGAIVPSGDALYSASDVYKVRI